LTLKRTNLILREWINEIVEYNKDWWNLGSAEGGGLAMNDGVAALVSVLRSVFEVLEKKGLKLIRCNDSEVVKLIAQYATALGKYLSSLD
jgi:hypothetical protein